MPIQPLQNRHPKQTGGKIDAMFTRLGRRDRRGGARKGSKSGHKKSRMAHLGFWSGKWNRGKYCKGTPRVGWRPSNKLIQTWSHPFPPKHQGPRSLEPSCHKMWRLFWQRRNGFVFFKVGPPKRLFSFGVPLKPPNKGYQLQKQATPKCTRQGEKQDESPIHLFHVFQGYLLVLTPG